MIQIKKNIANVVTSLNLFSGCLAVVYAFRQDYNVAVCFLLLAAVFDFADGFVARLLHAHSSLGKELDSLGDMVSFGVAPGVMLYAYLSTITGTFAFIAFLIPVFSAYRLAKFNIDVRQTTSFIGLATPANAIFWMFLVRNIAEDKAALLGLELDSTLGMIVVAAAVLLFCYLMVAEIPMFSLKFKTFTWTDNKIRFIFLLLSLLLIVLFRVQVFPYIILLYIVMAIVSDIFSWKKL